MTDYWLSKLFFDLAHYQTLVAQWKEDRSAVLEAYPLGTELRAAILTDDIAVLAPRVNAYLLRFYFAICGMSDAQFIGRLRALNPEAEIAHG